MSATLLTALLIDAATGEPRWLYARLPHPAAAMGGAIQALERALLHPDDPPARQRGMGAVLLVLVAAGAAGIGAVVAGLLRPLPAGWLLEAAAMSTLLAQRSLAQHVAAVAQGLERGLAEGRRAVARIVGRDPDRLDGPAVARAAIESLAENLSDGVVAPLFWGLLLGLPGMAAYKAINTADSMIGHKSARYRHFGWASARLDDLVNLAPARLTGALICLAGGLLGRVRLADALRIMRRDAPRHRSPNAGWPEAAMAAALGLRLNGPRAYGGVRVMDAWLGDGRAEADAGDVRRALRLAWAAWWLLAALLAAAAAVTA